MDEIEEQFQLRKGQEKLIITIKRMRTKFDIKFKCQCMKMKKIFNKGLKTKYIAIKKLRIKSDIKIKCEG